MTELLTREAALEQVAMLERSAGWLMRCCR